MTQLAETSPVISERAGALADLVRALAVAPSTPEVARQGAAALRRAFPMASAAHLHGLGLDTAAPGSLLDGPDPLAASPPAIAMLCRAAREQAPLIEILPAHGGEPEAMLAVAPVVHGGLVLGTIALSLAATPVWSGEDTEWLTLLAQQVSLGLAQARLREAHAKAERRYQEMSEAVEARAQARVEQLAGRGRQLEALFHLSSQISMTLDEAKVTTMALDHLIALTASRFGFVAMVDPAGALELGCVCGVGEEGREALRVNMERVKHWQGQGAQLSSTAQRLVKQFAKKAA